MNEQSLNKVGVALLDVLHELVYVHAQGLDLGVEGQLLLNGVVLVVELHEVFGLVERGVDSAGVDGLSDKTFSLSFGNTEELAELSEGNVHVEAGEDSHVGADTS